MTAAQYVVSAGTVPFGWVAGDDELGRVSAFRAALRERQWRSVVDVPCSTLVRDLNEEPAVARRRPPWRRVEDWAKLAVQRLEPRAHKP